MCNNLMDKVISTYQHHFKEKPTHYTMAPGRINLIGEHTDYSEGFVLPVAINRYMIIAFTPRNDNLIQLYSLDFDDTLSVPLDGLKQAQGGWKDYVMGMAWALIDSGYDLSGWQGVVAGNIPIGAGLSSSAAFEVAIGKTFCSTSNLQISAIELAKISRKAESQWVGVNVGIMDHLISAAGKENHALLLDCRNFELEYIQIPKEVRLIILDTNTRRELTSSAYNERHNDVREAAERLGLKQLRDATTSLLHRDKTILNALLFKRAKHVISENERVKDFVKAMRKSDLLTMGNIINQSHASLKDDFEVSSKELDFIVELAQSQTNCIGARMMGAGFGGCALAVINNDDTQTFEQTVHDSYLDETDIKPHIFEVLSAEGAHSYFI